MAVSSSRILRSAPRRICFSVSVANQRSTRLIREALVGVKCTWNRGRLSTTRFSVSLSSKKRSGVSNPPLSFSRHPEIYRPMWVSLWRSLGATTAVAPQIVSMS